MSTQFPLCYICHQQILSPYPIRLGYLSGSFYNNGSQPNRTKPSNPVPLFYSNLDVSPDVKPIPKNTTFIHQLSLVLVLFSATLSLSNI